MFHCCSVISKENLVLAASNQDAAVHVDKNTAIQNTEIFLNSLDSMHKRSYQPEDAIVKAELEPEIKRIMLDIEKGLQPYVRQFSSVDDLGVLESLKNGVDPFGNPGSAIEISAILHRVHFLYDLTPVPEYVSVGEGKVIFGAYNYRIGHLAGLAQEIVARQPAELNQRRDLGPFRSLADIITTYNALVAYVKRLKIIAEAMPR